MLTRGSFLILCFSAVTLAKPQMFPFSMFSDQAGKAKGKGAAYTFTHEGITPQEIITGCQGTKFANGDIHTEFYVIDSSGRKKFVYPGGSIEINFPASSISKSNPVGYNEMCFPKQCGVNTCGYVVGPVVVPEVAAKGAVSNPLILPPVPVTSLMTVGASKGEPKQGGPCATPCGSTTTTPAPCSTTTTPAPCTTTTTPAPCSTTTTPAPCSTTTTPAPCSTTTTTTTPAPCPTTPPPCETTTTPAPCPTTPAPCPTTPAPCPTTPAPCPTTPAPCPTTPAPCSTTPAPCGQHRSSNKDTEVGLPITDASYYAKLPGAIRGNAGVIYYPSCEKNAFHQVAIIPFCGSNPLGSKKGRDLKDEEPNELQSNTNALRDNNNEVKEENESQSL